MAEKKSTADILAALRAKDSKKAAAPAPPADVSSSDAPVADAPSVAGAPAGKPRPAPAKPAGGGPKSTADILAALRKETAAGKVGGPATPEASAAGPAAPVKPAPAKPAAGPAAGPKPSVQEMLRAVREGQPMAPPAAPKPAGPKPPRKPVAAKAAKAGDKAASSTTRRAAIATFLASPFALAWVMFSGAMGVFAAGLARFMMPNVLVEPPSKFNVGSLGKYAPDTVSEEYKAANGVWVVRTTYEGSDILYALISVCTHLGCTPGWLQGEQKFKCPCHGSGFYMTGINFEGPAPRPLERAGIRLLPDGSVEVDKSKKFQQEMGQWNDPASFVKLA